MLNPEIYNSPDEIAWCPGCFNHSILKAIKQALSDLEIPPHQAVFSSGIGQAAKLPHYLKCNLFNGLHGRALPVATGIKLANHQLQVIAEGGDGDGYAEGGNHFIHAARRNIGLTYLVHNNQIYGLTKGQTSPTSESGFASPTTPLGNFNFPEQPLTMAIASECSMVARGFAGDAGQLAELIIEGLKNPGFSFIDILQPCITFNKVNTLKWYQERVYKLPPEYDPYDKTAALARAQEWGDKIPTGIIYRNNRVPLEKQLPQISRTSLLNLEIEQEKRNSLINDFK
ncbi:MAG: 2-oxoacid:ferredoxin oxidoreductase subunit beta [Candidatus Edwardsbacteria bacterium]|nr:2-oxoacid:ferredoxin oxidoreductase subunit beta [Candidatus Edwardsbacteria bacterium]